MRPNLNDVARLPVVQGLPVDQKPSLLVAADWERAEAVSGQTVKFGRGRKVQVLEQCSPDGRLSSHQLPEFGAGVAEVDEVLLVQLLGNLLKSHIRETGKI